jgi:hypothetical protein
VKLLRFGYASDWFIIDLFTFTTALLSVIWMGSVNVITCIFLKISPAALNKANFTAKLGILRI